MYHGAVAENESEANGGELYREESSDEGECGGLLTEKELLAIYHDLDEDFVDEILGKGFTGAMVEKGGKIRMVAVQRSSTGGWVKVNTLDPKVRQILPPRHGCRIGRHHCKIEGQEKWQVRFGKILGYVRVGGYVYTLFSHFLNTALRTSSPPTGGGGGGCGGRGGKGLETIHLCARTEVKHGGKRELYPLSFACPWILPRCGILPWTRTTNWSTRATPSLALMRSRM